ncbi:SpaA isopeptide-forming pilin-related protein [Bifidobacterium stellenboschense]|uniref:Fimbrial subunit FimA n=1 Tax=Bifidobacterium stellenboschense TaxID=762211 RepID=A0A087DSU7_9BIFI|nr:SpaA isopeptide-forming pilin-related protein [Bifidobacterium stellenboschense]KFI98597.1 fimbrial subunit FimA [Bifidobacterium stellenboschense]
MKMRKLFAGLAAAATMLGGLALGAATANADEPAAADQVTFGTTITLKGEEAALQGRTFKAVKLADYGEASLDPAGIAVTTTTDNSLQSAIETALTDATSGATGDSKYTKADDGDAMAWVAQHLNDSGSAPWSGQLRKFVQNVASSSAYQNATAAGQWGTSLGDDDTTGKKTLTVSGLDKGLYLITDSTTYPMGDGAGKTWTRSIPILVGTGVFKDAAMTKPLLTTGSDGTAMVKNNEIPLIKTVEKVSVPNGQFAKYTVDSKVPNYVGYKTDTYTYNFVDTLEANKLAFPTEKVNGTDTVTAKSIGLKIVITPTQGQSVTIDPANDADAHADWYEFTDANTTAFTVKLKKFIDVHAGTVQTKDQSGTPVNVYSVNDTDWSGATVAITYKAKVLDAAYQKGADNDIKVQYSNNPSVNSSAAAPDYTEREDHEKVFNFDYQIVKKDKESKAPLQNAKFKLTGQGDNAGFTTEATSDAQGVAKFTGLAEGKYLVEETEVPSGHINAGLKYYLTITPEYNTENATKINGDPYQRKVSVSKVTYKVEDVTGGAWVSGKYVNGGTVENAVTPADETTKIVTSMDVLNVTNITQLPLTGAAGVALFAVLALLLAGAGAVVSFKSRSTKRALNA